MVHAGTRFRFQGNHARRLKKFLRMLSVSLLALFLLLLLLAFFFGLLKRAFEEEACWSSVNPGPFVVLSFRSALAAIEADARSAR